MYWNTAVSESTAKPWAKPRGMSTDDDCLPSVPQPHVGQCLVFGVDQGLRVFIVEGSIPKEVLDFVDARLVFGVAHACIVEGQGLAVERLG